MRVPAEHEVDAMAEEAQRGVFHDVGIVGQEQARHVPRDAAQRVVVTLLVGVQIADAGET